MLFVKSRIVRKPDATSTVSQTSTGVLQIPQTSRTQQAIIVLRNFVQAAAFNTIRAAQIIKAYFARLVAGSKEIAQTPTMQIATEKGRVFVAELAVVVKAFLVLMYSNISKFARATPSFVTPLLIRLKHKLATVDWLAQIFNVVQHSIIVAYLYLTPF